MSQLIKTKAISQMPNLMTLVMLYWKESIALKECHNIEATYSICDFQMVSFIETRKYIYPELQSDSFAQISELIMYLIDFCLKGSSVEDLDLVYATDLEAEIILQGLNWVKYLFETDHLVF